jgi:hypothetical protein
MLRDWTDSEKMLQVSVHAERFFIRLIMKVDDYGCFHANTSLLKANLFPLLLDVIREADISRWTTECHKAGLIVLYEAEGKKYLQINDFKQRLDRAKNKYPLPPSNDSREIVNDFPAEIETEVEEEIEVEKEKARAPDDLNDMEKLGRESSSLNTKRAKSVPGGRGEISNPFSDEFKAKWEEWKNYKAAQFSFKYKHQKSEQEAINELFGLADGNEEKANQIIKQSMAKGWRGLFAVKNDQNGITTRQSNEPRGAVISQKRDYGRL